jgi:hypothetical protein
LNLEVKVKWRRRPVATSTSKGKPMKPKTFADLYKDAEAHEDYWIAGGLKL